MSRQLDQRLKERERVIVGPILDRKDEEMLDKDSRRCVSDLRDHSADVLGVDEFGSGNKQTLSLHLLEVFFISDLEDETRVLTCF